jgi:hypothetical protein
MQCSAVVNCHQQQLPTSCHTIVLRSLSFSPSRIITCMMIDWVLTQWSVSAPWNDTHPSAVAALKTLIKNVDLILCISIPAFSSEVAHVPPNDRLRTTDIEDVDAAPIQNHLVVMNHQSTARVCTVRANALVSTASPSETGCTTVASLSLDLAQLSPANAVLRIYQGKNRQ